MTAPTVTYAGRESTVLDAARFARSFSATVVGGALVLRTAELVLPGDQLKRAALAPRTAGPLDEAPRILFGNLRVLLLVLGAALIVRHGPRAAARALTGVLLAVAALNATALAVALAADLPAALNAVAWHGPLELLAFSLAAALYRSARQPARSALVGLGLASAALLAVAAVLEVRAL